MLAKRMELLEYHVQLEDSAVNFLADKGFDSKFGVRPLQRAIQRYIEDPLAEEIVTGSFHPGDTVVFSAVEAAEKLTLAIQSNAAKASDAAIPEASSEVKDSDTEVAS